jgi:hypothetical protein
MFIFLKFGEKMSSSSEPKNNDKTFGKSIKYGLIAQESPNINVYEIFNSYFTNSKPNSYKIKDENHYEFCHQLFPDKTETINNLREIEKIYKKYENFNFFLVFIDIQNSKSIDFIDNVINVVIDAGETSYNKKCYVFGFYKDDNNPKIPEEKIITILEAKGIDYYYNKYKDDDIDKFTKSMERIINDCNNIMAEKVLAQKHSELVLDQSKSRCVIL